MSKVAASPAPLGMYDLKPVFDLDAKVDVPTCMYSLPVIQSSTPIEGIGMSKVRIHHVCR